jgi:hypothetical protein
MKAEEEFYNVVQTYWREHNYLTLRWWLLVILSILSPIIWWMFVDKKKLTELTSFGLFYGVTAIILDSIGSSALVWTYPVRLTPYLFPQLYPYDVGIVIIPFMLVYQRWGHTARSFFVASGLLSAALAFLAEPFMEWLHVYKELAWKNLYSFPVYWLLAFVCWFIIKRFKQLEQQ